MVAESKEDRVPGGAVTADVNDLFRLHFYHGGVRSIAAFPRRTHYDDICLNAFVFAIFQEVLPLLFPTEFCIGKAV